MGVILKRSIPKYGYLIQNFILTCGFELAGKMLQTFYPCFHQMYNKHVVYTEDDIEEKANSKMGVKHSHIEENFLTLIILLFAVSMQ